MLSWPRPWSIRGWWWGLVGHYVTNARVRLPAPAGRIGAPPGPDVSIRPGAPVPPCRIHRWRKLRANYAPQLARSKKLLLFHFGELGTKLLSESPREYSLACLAMMPIATGDETTTGMDALDRSLNEPSPSCRNRNYCVDRKLLDLLLLSAPGAPGNSIGAIISAQRRGRAGRSELDDRA